MIEPGRARDATVVVAAAVVAFVSAWFATFRYGVGISPDSAVYIWAATNLEAGRGLRILDGAPYVHWGPLYPAMLAAALRIGVGVEFAARLLGAAGYALFVSLGALWLRRSIPSRALWWVSVGAIVISTPIFDVYTYAWSESLLLLCVALFLFDADRAVRDGGVPLVRLAAWAALAALARYAGATLALSGALLLLADPSRSWTRRLPRAALFFAASLLPLSLWLARNVRLSGWWIGERPEAGYSWLEAFGNVLAALGALLFSPLLSPMVRAEIPVIAGVAVLCLLVMAARHRKRVARRSLLAAVAVAVPYLAMLVCSTAMVATDRASDRLVSPVALPLLGIAFASITAALPAATESGAWLRRRRVWVLVLLAVWLPPHLARTILHAQRAWAHGVSGYTDRNWRDSAIARTLPDRKLAGVIYSNAPDAYFYFTRREARLSPRNSVYYTNASPVPGEMTAFAESIRAHDLAGREAHLVWFLGSHRSFMASPAMLGQDVALAPEWATEDGIVYRVTSR